MNMKPQDLRARLMSFAVAVSRVTLPLFDQPATRALADQLQRAAGSAAANYRSAGRARSHAEFRSRLAVALEEADEALHWLQLGQQTGQISLDQAEGLIQEAGEIVAILGASRRTALRHAQAKDRAAGRR